MLVRVGELVRMGELVRVVRVGNFDLYDPYTQL